LRISSREPAPPGHIFDGTRDGDYVTIERFEVREEVLRGNVNPVADA